MTERTLDAAVNLRGPVISCYLDRGRGDALVDSAEWQDERRRLIAAGATEAALDAAEARMALPVPEDVSGQAIFVSPDGSTVGEFGADPPRWDLVRFDSLAYVAPMMEWHQMRIPHLVVVVGEDVTEILSFPVADEPTIHPVNGGREETTRRCRALIAETGASLVVISGAEEVARDLFQRLVEALPVSTRVRRHDGDDALADAVVREVADLSASTTVELLREFRFHRSHGDAAEGVGEVVAALATGEYDVLLLHDDPEDPRRAWFGPGAFDIGSAEASGLASEGRLVDVCIRCALRQGKQVRVIPSTGDAGPADDLGVFRRSVVPEGLPAAT